MEIYLHRPDDTPMPVLEIARPAYDHRITGESGKWVTWAGSVPREIWTVDEMHVDIADLLGLAKLHQDTVVVEGHGRFSSFVFPAGDVSLILEVRSDPAATSAERDRSRCRSMDERERASRNLV
ncbi:hypothetical protein JCM18899A_47340 [Nocardioides sp. AN3]